MRTTGRTAPRMSALILALAFGLSLRARAFVPYGVDAATLQLWHLDETNGTHVAVNVASNGIGLRVIANGASLGTGSLPGFGAAASLLDGGQSDSSASARDAYLGPLPLAADTSDNLPLACTGTNGAFTFEALVFADFNPSNTAGVARQTQILSADGDGSTDRVFQFRIEWATATSTSPSLQFVNIAAGVQNISAALPLTGSNALARSNWYHVAVAYNGLQNTASNLTLFWTRAETNRTRADALAVRLMTNDLPATGADWTIGNEGRSVNGSDGNWLGLLDEVRISATARGATNFLFDNDTDGDGLDDAWESLHFTNLAQSAASDPDGDGHANQLELLGGSDPRAAASIPSDSDADGLPDLWEQFHFLSETNGATSDPDGDGFGNALEYAAGTNPADPLSNPGDTDGDGLSDAWELTHFGNLAQTGVGDPDGDGFSNAQEFVAGTAPTSAASTPLGRGPALRYIPVEDGDTNTSEFGYAGSSGINAICFTREALMTLGDWQYLAYYFRHESNASHTNNNRIVLARRHVNSNTWAIFRTSFTANAITDGHDTASFGIDGFGFLHLSWGMHGDAFHYARTTTSVTNGEPIVFGPDRTMTTNENAVTYPQFLTMTNGDLLYFFREGGSGDGDTYLNRYYLSSQTWSNVHRSGTNQIPFIKGRTWTPNYNAYPNMPQLDPTGRFVLVWTWRYNGDSPTTNAGFQTNHDFDFAQSTDNGLTWCRQNGSLYTLPITEKGEAGTNTMAEKVLSIPEGYSLINQAGMYLDSCNQPVIATWWSPGTGTNNFRRQYMVAFPSTNGWQTRQISWRTNDSPSVLKPESEVRDLGRPIVVVDPEDRIVVVYRDNFESNGLTVVHSAPRANDPERRVWTSFTLTTADLGFYEPIADYGRWKRDGKLHLLYQPQQGFGFTPTTNTSAQIAVLEWDAAAYFAHTPPVELSWQSTGLDARITFASQPGWGYRLASNTALTSNWIVVGQTNGTGGPISFLHTGAGADPTRFWRLELREGGFPP